MAEQPSWWLYGERNEVVAWAGDTFPSLRTAENAALSFRSDAARAKFELYQDRSRRWRWRAFLADTKIASSGEAYLSELSARRAANAVRDNVAHAVPTFGTADLRRAAH